MMNKMCCIIMLTEYYKYAKYQITIQQEEQHFKNGEFEDSIISSQNFRANEVVYLTEEGMKAWGIDKLLEKVNTKGE